MRNFGIGMVCIIMASGVAVRDGCCVRTHAMFLGKWRENIPELIGIARDRCDQHKECDTDGQKFSKAHAVILIQALEEAVGFAVRLMTGFWFRYPLLYII